ncbi:MAG: glycosyltransferase family 2 protein [Lentisphaeria bacterium]
MNPHSNRLSIVVPVYMGRVFLRDLYERVKTSAESAFPDFELILVNDASPDNAWPDIAALCKEDPRIKGINLSRNFGQHYAITAGLTYVTGEWVVVMDCDLQDVPEEIPNLYQKAREGYDSVFAQRHDRQDGILKRLQSRSFYKILGYLTDTKLDHSVANFGIYHHKVIQSILFMEDNIRYFPTMSQWVGFRKAYLPVSHGERKAGASSYSLIKLLRLATDNIIAFSDKPLKIFTYTGFAMSAIALLIAIFYYSLYLTDKIKVQGYASLILSVWFIGGILMFSLGIIGIYIGKIFDQVKGRPTFIISDKINMDGHA